MPNVTTTTRRKSESTSDASGQGVPDDVGAGLQGSDRDCDCDPGAARRARDVAKTQRARARLRAAYYAKYEGRCFWCLTPVPPENFDLDHLIPGDKSWNKSNSHLLVVACRPCNELRSNTPVSVWLRWLGKLHGRLTLDQIKARLAIRHKPLLDR